MLRHRRNDGNVVLCVGGIEQRVETSSPGGNVLSSQKCIIDITLLRSYLVLQKHILYCFYVNQIERIQPVRVATVRAEIPAPINTMRVVR